MKIRFYSRANCSLCIEAWMMLQLVKEDVHLDIEEINIEENDEIHEKYVLRIPVIEYKGEVIQEGRIDYPTLLEAFNS
ncbi:glutaredoxin family protein [Paenisporosarcina antarctica]|uniref:Glutaredoxin family protein n=1 Tax=Paenisporosarcina antarctica TaxID=417367 RepID=A0A4P6ZYE7_9BACL|nr:glutaredoxin family protein [Paenisporosarcina antarctica]QBP40496.1 glutaredoxin family protein [Paenisporosarcina antarctica]